MPRNRKLGTLLAGLPERTRDELLMFLAFSDRRGSTRRGDTIEELLVSLSFLNKAAHRPN